ncbi:helicase, SNF2 family [Leifsonia rubra CMS 76R]|nr:helicase, SNF2 family [Leifsonia rubra CMS 76R]
MSEHETLPAFASNRPDLHQTVGGEVSKMFRILREKFAPDVSIATAYINPGGFSLLADELEKTPRIRLLLGAEPDQASVRAIAEHDADRDQRVSAALRKHEDWLMAERDTLGFSREAVEQAHRMVEWLHAVDPDGEARVEVRRYSEGFLHGKAYISDDPSLPAVMAGSSNMTFAGLSQNAELNLGYPAGDTHHVAKVVDWFDHYWNQSDPYDLAELYEHQWDAHQPWTIFMRMLWELYGANIEEEKTPVTQFGLARFQSDGVARMERLLENLGGVLVADEVGLGKTYLAAEVIYKATEERRQRVMIVCPAALKKGMWEPFLKHYGFRLTDVFSYEEIRNRLDEKHADYENFSRQVEDYSMVVIDEAHNLRNSTTARAEAVDRAILGGKFPKKVVLLTATPVNNSLTDLETLIKYFIRDDAQFSGINIPSIRKYIKDAQALDPENLTPEHLFDLMDQVAVRRTRKFVKEQYPGETITGPGGKPMLIKFPKPKVRRVDYDLDDSGRELIDRVVYALDLPEDTPMVAMYDERKQDPNRLVLARYTASAYSIDHDLESYQISNVGLLRSALLKRLESSPHALANTLGVLVGAHKVFLDGLDKGYVLRGGALREWASSESDDLDEFVQNLDEDDSDQAQERDSFHHQALQEDVESDLALLEELRELALATIADGEPKADALIQELTRIAENAQGIDASGVSGGDRRKVIVFSTYSDTIVDLHERVSAALAANPTSALANYVGRLAEPVMGAYKSTQKAGKSGGVNQGGRAGIVEGFAPATAGELADDGTPRSTDKYDILLTTDVLAEGVNLQQAGQIINYDLPWNPMRIVQRHGRVDRIGSKHDTVELGLFFPSDKLDKLLGLEATLERKLAQAEAAVGTGQVLPGRIGSTGVILADKNRAVEEIEGLLETRGSSAALSGEEYRRRLYQNLNADIDAKDEILSLPYGSGSGFENPNVEGNGYVFCIKIGEHAKPWFRYVPVDSDWAPIIEADAYVVLDDTLRSLVAADPQKPNTQRWMSDEVYERAFDSWTVARDDAFARWTFLTDVANLTPDSPKSFRDARDLVYRSGDFLSQDQQLDLLLKLQSVPSAKVARAVRAALKEGSTPREQIELVADQIEAAGIQAPPKVEPLDPVTEREVRLVVWMAVRGTRAQTSPKISPVSNGSNHEEEIS